MQKFSTLCIILFSATMVTAQFQKNNILLNGYVSFGSNKTSPVNSASSGEGKNLNAGLGLTASKFISGNAYYSLGLTLSTSSSKLDNGFGSVNENSGNTTGISFGYTLLSQLANRFYMSFPFSLTLNMAQNKSEQNGNKINSANTTGTSLNGGIGLLYLTKKRLVLSCTLPAFVSVGFNQTRYKSYGPAGQVSTTAKTNGIFATGGLTGSSLNNLSVGIGYLFNK